MTPRHNERSTTVSLSILMSFERPILEYTSSSILILILAPFGVYLFVFESFDLKEYVIPPGN
jgi:hypothetical protein